MLFSMTVFFLSTCVSLVDMSVFFLTHTWNVVFHDCVLSFHVCVISFHDGVFLANTWNVVFHECVFFDTIIATNYAGMELLYTMEESNVPRVCIF